jgi:hypothetical protein
MSNPPDHIRIVLEAELVTIRAQMQAAESTMRPGQCPVAVTDPYYAQQEAIKQLLEAMDNAE